MRQKEELNTGKKVEQIWTDLAKGEGDEHVRWGALHFHWKQRSHEKRNTLQFIIYNQHQHQCIKKYNQRKSKFEENYPFWEMFHFKSWFQSRQKFPPETQGGGRKRKSELINKHFQTESP